MEGLKDDSEVLQRGLKDDSEVLQRGVKGVSRLKGCTERREDVRTRMRLEGRRGLRRGLRGRRGTQEARMCLRSVERVKCVDTVRRRVRGADRGG